MPIEGPRCVHVYMYICAYIQAYMYSVRIHVYICVLHIQHIHVPACTIHSYIYICIYVYTGAYIYMTTILYRRHTGPTAATSGRAEVATASGGKRPVCATRH